MDPRVCAFTPTLLLAIAAVASQASAELIFEGEIPILGGVNSVVFDSSGEVAYVSSSGNLFIVDTIARQVSSTISWNGPSQVVAVDPSATFVAGTNSDVVFLRDLRDGSQREVLDPSRVGAVVIANGFVYNAGSNGIEFAPLEGGVEDLIDPDPEGVNGSCALLLSPSGDHLLLGDRFGGGRLYLIETPSHQVVAEFGVGVEPCSLAFADDETAIVALENQIGIIDLSDVASIPRVVPAPGLVPCGSRCIAVDLGTESAYLINSPFYADEEVIVLDLATESVRSRASIAGSAIALDPNGVLFVADEVGLTLFADDALSSPDPTPSQDQIFILGGVTGPIVVDPSGDGAYVSNGGTLFFVDLVTRTPGAIFPLGNNHSVQDLDETGKFAAIIGGKESVVDLSDGSIIPLIDSFSVSSAVLANGFLYAASFNDRGINFASLDGELTGFIDPGPKVDGPCALIRSPDRSRLILGDRFDGGRLYVMTTPGHKVIADIGAGDEPCALAFTGPERIMVALSEQIGLFDLADLDAPPLVINLPGLRVCGSRCVAVDIPAQRAFLLSGDYYEDPDLIEVDLQSGEVVHREAVPNSRSESAIAIAGDGTLLVANEQGLLLLPEPGSRWLGLAALAVLPALARWRRRPEAQAAA